MRYNWHRRNFTYLMHTSWRVWACTYVMKRHHREVNKQIFLHFPKFARVHVYFFLILMCLSQGQLSNNKVKIFTLTPFSWHMLSFAVLYYSIYVLRQQISRTHASPTSKALNTPGIIHTVVKIICWLINDSSTWKYPWWSHIYQKYNYSTDHLNITQSFIQN